MESSVKNYTSKAVLFLWATSAAFAQAPTNFQTAPAVFRVTETVANPDVEPFSVTVSAFGNSLKRRASSGFEPVQFRTLMIAGESAKDRIVPSDENQLTDFNSWSDGYLDGAEVCVYRVVNEKMTLVRRDRVAVGGSKVSGWNHNTSKLLPPNAREAWWAWAPWSRTGTSDFFTITAVDKSGNLSAGNVVTVKRPDTVPDKAAQPPKMETIAFRADKRVQLPSPPANPRSVKAEITPEGFLHMTWEADSEDNLAGFCISQSDTDPAKHEKRHLRLENASGEPILLGDMVIVSKNFRDFNPAWISNRLANLERIYGRFLPGQIPNGFLPGSSTKKSWTLRDHEKNTPVSEPGQTYLEMTLSANETEKIGKSGIPDISTKEQNFYPVPRPVSYRMEVWAKADRADAPPVVFESDGDQRVGGFLKPFSFQLGTEWKRFEHTFQGEPAAAGNHAFLVLKCTGPATYSFDNFRIYRADAPFLGWNPEQVEQFKASGMKAVRMHGSIKTAQATYSMEEFTNPGGLSNGIEHGNTLPQMLLGTQQLGGIPWLQVEFHMSPEEWLGFVEYLAAPYDPAVDSPKSKPWAFKRYSQGRTQPWTDAFDRIYFELSNETWNALFRPWLFPAMTDSATGKPVPGGSVYAKMQDFVADKLRSSPYWNADLEKKFIHVLGGWANPTSSYSRDAATGGQAGEFITIAAYNGGWDEGEGTPKPNAPSFFNVLNHVNSAAVPRSKFYADLKSEMKAAGREIQLGTYEAGPGYALDGLNNDKVTKEQANDQELVMKSKAAGVATLDSFLAHSANGFTLQNFFTFDEGDLWKSHAKWWRGGVPHPSFLALSLFNTLATGSQLVVETVSTPTVDLPKFKRRQEISQAPQTAAYAFRKDNRLAVICINRLVPDYPTGAGTIPFTLELPISKAKSITLHRMSGSHTDTNIEGASVVATSTPVPLEALENGKFKINQRTGSPEDGLPPAEMFLYVFEDVVFGKPSQE